MAALAASAFNVYQRDMGDSLEATDSTSMKELIIETVATADNGDTIALDVSAFGWSKVARVKGFKHTVTAGIDAIALEAPTTSVSGTTLTITVGGSTANLKRVFIVGGY